MAGRSPPSRRPFAPLIQAFSPSSSFSPHQLLIPFPESFPFTPVSISNSIPRNSPLGGAAGTEKAEEDEEDEEEDEAVEEEEEDAEDGAEEESGVESED